MGLPSSAVAVEAVGSSRPDAGGPGVGVSHQSASSPTKIRSTSCDSRRSVDCDGDSGEQATGEQATSEQARKLFEAAKSKYEHGDLNRALELMQQSYELSRIPELLYNVGDLNHKLARCRPALEAYRNYLRQVEAGAHRTMAAQAVEQLGHECPDDPAGNSSRLPVVTPPQQRDAPYWTTARIAGCASLGVGLAAGVGAVVFGWKALDAAHRYQDLQKTSAERAIDWNSREGESLEAEGSRYQAWEVGLAVTGGMLTTAGVLLLVYGSPETKKSVPRVSVDTGPGAGSITWSASF